MQKIFLESMACAEKLEGASAVTVGVFDGMHRGHLKVLDLLYRTGDRLDLVKTVVTFTVHPERLLNGKPPDLILPLKHRLRLLERTGVERVVLLPFDRRTRETPAEEFLEAFLVKRLGLKAFITGRDSAFGKDRKGNADFLEARKARYGFEVLRAPEVRVRGEVISSTRIRDAVRSGDLDLVEAMLGRELSLFGTVVHGDSRGRRIGFPTANLACETTVLPPNGVYAVRVLHQKVMWRGVMNLGQRPTFTTGETSPTVEVHLPGFEGDLYGEELEVFLIRKIREEKKFGSVEELARAIRRDIASLDRTPRT